MKRVIDNIEYEDTDQGIVSRPLSDDEIIARTLEETYPGASRKQRRTIAALIKADLKQKRRNPLTKE